MGESQFSVLPLLLPLSGFCHYSLVLFMVLWQSPDTPVMSCFHAISRLRALFHVGAWCSDPGTRVLSFGFVSGFGHSRSTFCLFVWVCGLEFARPHALLSTCVLLCCTQFVFFFIGCVHSCYILCCVAHSLCISLAVCFHVVMSCVNMWLMSFLISCVFMSCFAHGWWFVCWPCACVFVLWEHMAFVLVFCVPCALMSICLDPTHLVTCLLIHFSQLLSLVTLLICSLYNLLVFAVPCWFVVVRLTSYVLCPALPCLALPCLALPCLFASLFLFVLFIIINKKPVLPPAIGSLLSSLPTNLTAPFPLVLQIHVRVRAIPILVLIEG